LLFALLGGLAWAWLGARGKSAAPPAAGLRFEVTAAEGLLSGPADGRLLLVLGRRKSPEPRLGIQNLGMRTAPVLGRDVKGLAAGRTAVVDRHAAIFPLGSLAELPRGDYWVQAVFDHNRDLRLPSAPGNLYSEPVKVSLDPTAARAVKVRLTRKLPADTLPKDSEHVKFIKLYSRRLSSFHGRPMYLRAAVVLPADYAKEKERRYPLRVHIAGYGGRYTGAGGWLAEGSAFRKLWLAKDTPRFLLLHPDGAGPFGDPFQVNSANSGPYGEALTKELIPYVERRFRGIGRPYARVLSGASTGGWVSLALQVFYPDFFNGAWSHCPDPVDFRAFELINIYRDENAYVNGRGFERPASRDTSGDVRWTVRHECGLERVLGRGDNWALSGKDWAGWNAAFGPRGEDGLPVPLWDGKSGKINRSVVEHWQKYDLRLVMQRNWSTLGPKLRGKLRVWVGDADEYFLNNAVRLLHGFLARVSPPHRCKITYGPNQGHNWRGLGEAQTLKEMAAAVAAGKRAAEGR
jgi:hypothetical protein